MRRMLLAVLALGAMLAAHPAAAQDFGGTFSGFSSDSKDPIQIEADTLTVDDTKQVATYKGHVRVRQGETLLEAPELRIFYTDTPKTTPAPGAMPAPQPTPAAGASGPAGSQVSRIEAGPGVTVKSKDQTATGDRAVVDMKTEIVTLSGNVILTQGGNVVRGERLVVNMQTRQGRMEGGRVQTLIAPSSTVPAP